MGDFIVLVIIGIIIWAVVSAHQKKTAEKVEADMRAEKYRKEKEIEKEKENEKYTQLVAAINKVKAMNPRWVVGEKGYFRFISFKSAEGFKVKISVHNNVDQYRLEISKIQDGANEPVIIYEEAFWGGNAISPGYHLLKHVYDEGYIEGMEPQRVKERNRALEIERKRKAAQSDFFKS